MLEKEGDYPLLGGTTLNLRLDNFTDTLMLNTIYNVDYRKPVSSAFRAANFTGKGKNGEYIGRVQRFLLQLETAAQPNWNYARYWHGYMVTLRPLLIFFNYEEIRFLNTLLFATLLTVLVNLLSKKIGSRFAVVFIASLCMVSFHVVPWSLQLSNCFLVLFFSLIPLLNNKIAMKALPYYFFSIGCVVVFFDLLTIPIITVGIPIVIIVLVNQEFFNNLTGFQCFRKVGSYICAWLLGFVITGSAKWILSSIVLHENIIADGYKQFLHWQSYDAMSDNTFLIQSKAIMQSVQLLFGTSYRIAILFLLLVFLLILTLILFREPVVRNKVSIILASVIFLPYLWYAFLAKSTLTHFWFVFRAQFLTLFSFFCLLVNWIDGDKLRILWRDTVLKRTKKY